MPLELFTEIISDIERYDSWAYIEVNKCIKLGVIQKCCMVYHGIFKGKYEAIYM